jgi:hypothetical protein
MLVCGGAEAAYRGDVTMWVVWRQDDNGNRYVVRRFPASSADPDEARAAADALVAEMEAHGHKQTYWVEPHEG